MEKQDKSAAERAEKTAVSGENGALAPGEPENKAPRGESAADGREASVKPARPVEEPEADLRYKDGKAAFKGGVLGFFIGLAVIVPGVSGSTVAILFRLYEKLLYALGNIFKKFKKCARFLFPIAVGLVVGLLIGFFAVQNLVELVPFAVVGLFAGLMLGAFPAVSREIRGEKITPWRAALFALGLALPVVFGTVSALCFSEGGGPEQLQAYHYILFVVLGAAIAVTQLVPGLSASALLMAAGYFSYLLDSVHLSYWAENPLIFAVYACLAVGFIAGLIGFSRALSGLLSRFRAPSFFAVCGLSLGSAAAMFFNPEMYAVYQSWASGGVAWLDLCLGIALFAAGLFVAYKFSRYVVNK